MDLSSSDAYHSVPSAVIFTAGGVPGIPLLQSHH